MTDYSRLPREELIKEILVWQNRCVDQQLVYLDDIQPSIDLDFANVKAAYEAAAEKLLEKAREYERKIYGDTGYMSGSEATLASYGINAFRQFGPKQTSLRDIILNFLMGKQS